MDYTKSVGNVTELKCLIGFMELGYDCALPYGDASKYDFVVDLGGRNFARIQCKTSKYINDHGVIKYDGFSFHTTNQTVNTKKVIRRKYTVEEIDYFATYFKGKVYVIPVEECSTTKTLRFSPPQYGDYYNKAEDYEIEKVFGLNGKYIKSKDEYENRSIISKDLCQKEYKCKLCGKSVGYGNDMCEECPNIEHHKVKRPSMEDLKSMV